MGAAASVVLQVGAAASIGGWSVATVPGTGGDDVLLGSTCANAWQCWAVGVSIQNINTSGSFSPLVESWNGTVWTLEPQPPLPVGDGGGFFDVSCVSGSDCWAVGTVLDNSGSGNSVGTLIEHWDGGAWSIVPSPTPSGAGITGAILQSVSCTTSADCVAVGYSTGDTGTNLNALLEQWNGTSWTIVSGGATGQTYDELTAVQCLDASDCWAVGDAGPNQQNPNFLPIFPAAVGDQGLTEHWDGAAWSVVPSPAQSAGSGGYLQGLACTGPDDCWASGASTDPTFGMASGVLMEHWGGSTWTDVSGSVATPPTGSGAILSGISCTGAGQCWAAGSTGPFGGGGGSNFKPQAFVENWNGSSWSVCAEPRRDGAQLLELGELCRRRGVPGGGERRHRWPRERPRPAALRRAADVPAGVEPGHRAGGTGRRRLQLRDRSVRRVPGRDTPERAGGRRGGDAGRQGVLAGGRRRRRVRLRRRALRRFDGWAAPGRGGRRHGGDTGRPWLLAGRLRRRRVRVRRRRASAGPWAAGRCTRRWRGWPPRERRLLARGLRRGRVQLRRRGVRRIGGVQPLARPVTGMAGTPDAAGYWLVAADGGVFAYGDAAYAGSVPGQGITGQPGVVGVCPTPTGAGYWVVGSNGAVYTYGDATFLGAPDGRALAAPVAGIASS